MIIGVFKKKTNRLLVFLTCLSNSLIRIIIAQNTSMPQNQSTIKDNRLKEKRNERRNPHPLDQTGISECDGKRKFGLFIFAEICSNQAEDP